MKHIVVISILALLSFASCEKGTTPCVETRAASAILSDFPSEIKVGTVQTIEIQYILENSCGEFDHFEITQNGSAFDVSIVNRYEGCSCKLEFIERSAFFDIDIDFPGVYQFNFWLADGDYDSRTITVFE
jgi:hypothetical protein